MANSSLFATYPSLKGRSVFITGGGSGIGAALVRRFAAQGSRVAFVDIALEPSRALVEEITAEGQPSPLFIECDLRDIEALQSAVREAADAHGLITVLVNNAAHDERHKFEEVSVDYGTTAWR
jgi:D-xylose 1-dehydrogenase